MSHKRTHFIGIIGTIGIILIASVAIVWYTYPSFLSSSVFEASAVVSDTGESRLSNMRLERERITIEKKRTIENYVALKGEKDILDVEIKKIDQSIADAQKELDSINNAIAAIPTPNLFPIEEKYKNKTQEENKRYEEQKLADQKLYIDTMYLIKKTYDTSVELIKKTSLPIEHERLIQEAADLATTNRQNALESLTKTKKQHLIAHEEILGNLDSEKQREIAQLESDIEMSFVPLLKKKNIISENKADLQRERAKLESQLTSLSTEIQREAKHLNEIESLLKGIDYTIFILEESLLPQE
jgi:chromosome segregation ATPase